MKAHDFDVMFLTSKAHDFDVMFLTSKVLPVHLNQDTRTFESGDEYSLLSYFRLQCLVHLSVLSAYSKENMAGKDLQPENIIKIMPCVEGDRSDCQLEENSIARSRRLRSVVVVEG